MDNTPSHHNVEIAFEVAQKLDFLHEKFNSKLLFREDGFQLVLIALLGSQEIPTHKTPRNAYLYCIEGEAVINIGGADFPLKKGEIILLPKDIPHGVKASEKTKLLLLK